MSLWLVAPLRAQEPQAPPPESQGAEAVSPEEEEEEEEEEEVETPPETSAEEPGEEPPPSPEPPDGRIDFQFSFPPERGGGTVVGRAGGLSYGREGTAVLRGGVEARYQDLKIQADRVEVNLQSKEVHAQGNVVLDQGPRRLTGETLTFSLDTKTGTFTQASAFVAPDYFFSGAEISKVDDDTYTVTDGMFTSCQQEVPDWSFRLRRARVDVEGYARVRSASMRIKEVPVFYTPYILWPAKTERTSGFLIPNLGYTRRRGGFLGLAYYQVLGRSYDTTFHLDLYSEEFLGLGNEFRYRPTEGTKGEFVGYAVWDPVAEEWRWKVELNQETNDLPWGLRAVVRYQDFSDFNFFREFERDIDRNSLRFLDSRGFVSGNWGPHSFNLLVNDRETFIGPGTIIRQQKLPEVEYRLRSTRLGRTPLYLRLDSSLDYLAVDRGPALDGSYGRLDLFPQFTLPIRSWPWLSLSVTAGSRFTWYGESLDGTGQAFTGESLTRNLPAASAEIIGPSFSRIFNAQIGRYGRFKHVIEPRWSYTFLGEFDDQNRVPLFDEVDPLRSTNLARVALVNRLLAKPAGQEGGVGQEILALEIAQEFSLDEDQPLQRSFDGLQVKRQGPITGLLRFNPDPQTSLRGQVAYNTLFNRLESSAISGTYGFRGNHVGLTWFTRWRPDDGEILGNQVRFFTGLDVIRNKVRLDAQVSYDIEQQLLQQQRYVVHYNAQCYNIRFEVRDFRAGDLRDIDYRFSVTLKNVGTFLDLTGRVASTP